jgi:putative endonuclease
MAADCKSAAPCGLRRFESSPVHQQTWIFNAVVECPRRKVTSFGFRAVVAQLVERVLGKDEVTSSILVNGSTILKHYVYVLRGIPTGRHYIGSTADVARRLDEHNTRNSRWTSPFKPWALVTTEEYESRREARGREAYLKSRAGIGERLRLLEDS